MPTKLQRFFDQLPRNTPILDTDFDKGLPSTLVSSFQECTDGCTQHWMNDQQQKACLLREVNRFLVQNKVDNATFVDVDFSKDTWTWTLK